MSNSKFRLAIVGGGITGLTLAIALTKSMKENDQHVHIDIYESAHAFTEVGAGVGLWRRPLLIMKQIGLLDELKLISQVHDSNANILSFAYRKSDQPAGINFYEMRSPMGVTPFHRPEFQKALMKHLDETFITAHFNKRLHSYMQTPSSDDSGPSPIIMKFKDGSSATCDVLIGADGIHSMTRGQMYEGMAEAVKGQDPIYAKELLGMKDFVWSGSIAYRGIIPRERLDAVAPGHRTLTQSMIYVGKDKHIVVLPIANGRFINVVAFTSEPEKEGTQFEGNLVEFRPQEELLNEYKGWEPEVIQLLQCIDKPSRWAINSLKELPTWTQGRVALTGDAAHAMMPHQGSGAGQGIDDAYILASLLAHPLTTLKTLPIALDVYDTIRRPLGNEIKNRSSENGHFYQLNAAEFRDIDMVDPPVERLADLGRAIVDNWTWAWTTDAETDRSKAVDMLEKRLGST